jgi:hypothetical protein
MLSLIVILSIFSLVVIYFVKKGATLTAQEALANYLRAVIDGRTETAYHYLSSANKTKQSLQDYKASHSLGHGLIAQVMGGKIAFIVEDVDFSGDRATATVSFTSPDFPLMIMDIFQEMPPAGIPEQTLESLTFVCRQISNFLDKYHGEGLPMRTARETFSLLREGEGWRVDPFCFGDNSRNPSPPRPSP